MQWLEASSITTLILTHRKLVSGYARNRQIFKVFIYFNFKIAVNKAVISFKVASLSCNKDIFIETTAEDMTLFEIFATSLVRLAYFIDEWFGIVVGAMVLFYVVKYFFIKDWNKILFNAAKDGDLVKVENALQNGADVNALLAQDATALIVASTNNHKDIVIKLLATDKCKVDIQDELGNTALFMAAKSGHVELVRLLLNRKADMKVPSNDGTTALVIAASKSVITSLWKLMLT